MTISSNPVRLPRYKRAEADVSLAITPRDLQILATIESFRLLDSAHILALTHGSDQGILRRLQKLYHAGLLDRLSPRFTPGGGSDKMIYAITNKGISTLQKEGLLKEVSATDRNAQNRDLHDFSIQHRLLVSHIRAMFMLACQADRSSQSRENLGNDHAMFSSVCQAKQPPQENSLAQQHLPGKPPAGAHALSFLFWKEGRELQDSIEVALPSRYARIPVAPDGFFGLQDAQGRRAHFAIEADRGTMSLKRFTLKLQAYAAWRREKQQEAKWGIKNFRVLTVTTSATRRRNLVEAAAAAEDVCRDARMFLFAAEDDLPLSSPESVFTKIWTMTGSGEEQALFRESIAKNPLPRGDHSPTVAPM